MHAMVLDAARRPLRHAADVPDPVPGPHQVLIRVAACGACVYCRSGRENLCAASRFTGYDIDDGYAGLAVADARFCFPLPAGFGDVAAAPLLCAGLIGYRALALAGAVKLRTTTAAFALAEANEALLRLRSGRITGAAVLVP